jgi:RHS repeat-associated protein
MANRFIRLLVALGLLVGGAIPSPAAAAVVRLTTSHETAKVVVPDRGADAANARSYFGARYYRAGLGRFTTVDPGHAGASPEDPQTWNAYAYAGNNPLRNIDPDGRRWFAKNGNAVWVDPNKDGSYTSPGDGWVELDPKNYDKPNVAFVDGVLSWISESGDGHKILEAWRPPEQGLEDKTLSLGLSAYLGFSAVRAGVEAVVAARGPVAALTEHGAARAALRNISQADIQSAMKNATQVITKMGKYGTPQKHYIGANGVTVIVEQAGRNAGKIVTVFRTGVQ